MRRLLIALLIWFSGAAQMPANTSCAAATLIGSLPYDFTESSLGGATELWWKYVTGPNETLISLVVSGNDTLSFRLSSGPNCAGLSSEFTEDLAVHIVEVVPSSAYWIRAFSFGGGLTSLRVRVSPMPDGALVPGALVIPNVFSGPQRATVFSPTGEVIKVVPGFPTGLAGDSLGTLALVQDDNPGVGGDAVLYNNTLTEIARLASYFTVTNAAASIRANIPTRTFWTADPHSAVLAVVRTVSQAGVIGGTTWNLTTAAQLEGMVPSRDETILYWADGASSAVHRYDLVNRVPLSDLAASLGAGWGVLRSMVVLTDDSICISYVHPAATRASKVIRYSPAGAVLSTYDVDALDPGQYLDSIARNLPESTKIWIWVEPPGGKAANPAVPMHFKLVDMAGLSVSASFNSDDFDNGVGSDHWGEPPQMWGPDSTAIFWAMAPPTLIPVIDQSAPCCGSGCDCHTPDTPGEVGPGASGPPCATDEPVVLEAFYRRCTGGGTVPTAADVEDSEDWADEFPPKEPDIWFTVQPQADEGEWKIGPKPLSDRGRFVEARVEEISVIERRSSGKDGDYPPARVRLVVNDDDGKFRGRLGDEQTRQFINREARADLLSYAGRKAGLDPIRELQGRLVDVQPALNRKAIIELQDIMGAQFGALDPQKTIGVPIGDEHPSLPPGTRGKTYQIILGEWGDGGKTNAQGEDVSRGVLPAYDCGDAFHADDGGEVIPDPEGRTFGDAAPIINQAIVNLTGSGDITSPIFMKAAPVTGGVIGQFSTTLVLDPNGSGAGGPSLPHAARYVFDEPAVPGTEYLILLFQDPAFDPVTNPTGDSNVRYKIVTAVPPVYPVHPEDSSQWGGSADFTSLTDGDQWGVLTTSAPLNLNYTITGTPGTTTWIFDVSAITAFGESLPSETLVITDGPAELNATDNIVLTWDQPSDNPDAVIDYRVRGRTSATPNQSLGLTGGATTFTDNGTAVPAEFNTCGEGTAVASDNVWAWMVCALGTVDVHDIYGSDLAENDAPRRTKLSTTTGYIDGPYVRTVGGIEQTGFWARGPVLNHHRQGLVTFAWNGCGYEGENGEVIDQAFLMLQTVLNEFVEKNNGEGFRSGAFGPIETFSDGTPKFWTSQFQAAQAQTAEWLGTELGYIGAMAILQPTALSEFLRQFFVTFGGHGTTNHWGQWYPYLINPTPAVGAGRIYRERMEIARLLDHRLAHDETENRVTYRYLYDPDGMEWRASPTPVSDVASISARGGDKIGVAETTIKDCLFGNDAATMADRWARHLTLYANPPRYVQWATNLKSLPDHNGASARFSHRKEGLGVNGETATPGVIMHTSVSLQPYEVIQTAMLFALASEDLLHLDELGVSAFGEVMVGG